MLCVCLLSSRTASGLHPTTTARSTALWEARNDSIYHHLFCCAVLQYWLCNVRCSRWSDTFLFQELRTTFKHGTCENMVSQEDKETPFLRVLTIGSKVLRGFVIENLVYEENTHSNRPCVSVKVKKNEGNRFDPLKLMLAILVYTVNTSSQSMSRFTHQ
jgi:hypothetical protein